MRKVTHTSSEHPHARNTPSMFDTWRKRRQDNSPPHQKKGKQINIGSTTITAEGHSAIDVTPNPEKTKTRQFTTAPKKGKQINIGSTTITAEGHSAIDVTPNPITPPLAQTSGLNSDTANAKVS